MFLTSILIAFSFLRVIHTAPNQNSTTGTTRTYCPRFPNIENGIVKIIDNGFEQFATVSCLEGYDLEGSSAVYCVGGIWEEYNSPQCSKRCFPPPDVDNGAVQIEGVKDDNGLFQKGTLATYTCTKTYYLSPPESKYRVCERGIWTAHYATCVPTVKITSCQSPKDLINGYFVHEKAGMYAGYSIGQRLHYSCNSGYLLIGSSVQQCLEDGTWSPKIPPICRPQISENVDVNPCPPSPNVPHSTTTILQGFQSDDSAEPGTIVQIHCISKYRNSRSPCQPGKLRCRSGQWIGILPNCVPARECSPPPPVTFATVYNLNPAAYETTFTNKYPIKSEVSYQCLPGYILQGNEILGCSAGGCWLPADPPTCYRAPGNYYLEVNSINAILISAATGAGVLGLLMVICLITVCRRRKPLSRAVAIGPPVQRSDLGDHASLLHHPDRLALIAFADGMQNDQSALPTYDEATRDRTPGLTANRLHRPHWPNLAGRRTRNTPNPDMVHVTRHGSFVSHTPSTRSAADSMGSTDTMAVSEGSTNVTLDTASSHSGSQPASCRVHCGSLASFDTSSVANTEGVPLLEESELEEIQGGDNVSLVVESHSISDNASYKLSTASADLS